MTHGTSAHGGDLSRDWTDAGHNRADFGWWHGRLRLAGEAAPIELAGIGLIAGLVLGLALITAWQAAAEAILHLATLIAAGAVVAAALLRPRRKPATLPPVRAHRPAPDEPSPLLAQMHHELRTPLNAVIGFSEVMAAELHGPLGNSRYQEYAAHISESGGRLLKASEDALAVAATMSALAVRRPGLRRQRLPAAGLLREAWEALAAPGRGLRLRVVDQAAIEVECDWQVMSLALQHLLGEAAARAAPGTAVVARCGVQSGLRRVEIEIRPELPLAAHAREIDSGDGGCVRLMLARTLIEQQGAALTVCAAGHGERWSASIAFPPVPAQSAARHAWAARRTPSEASRQQLVPVHRGDFLAAAVARASAGSRAAPPA